MFESNKLQGLSNEQPIKLEYPVTILLNAKRKSLKD